MHYASNMCNIIVFKNLRFHPSTLKRVASVHSGERFWKDAFSVTVFPECVWMVGQTGERISIFKQKRIRVVGASDFQVFALIIPTCLLVALLCFSVFWRQQSFGRWQILGHVFEPRLPGGRGKRGKADLHCSSVYIIIFIKMLFM